MFWDFLPIVPNDGCRFTQCAGPDCSTGYCALARVGCNFLGLGQSQKPSGVAKLPSGGLVSVSHGVIYKWVGHGSTSVLVCLANEPQQLRPDCILHLS